MKREGFKANITTKNTVIAGLVKHGLLKEALQVCLSMEQEGLIGDIVTWNSLLSGLLYHGHNKEALILFSFVLKTNLKPTVPSFVAILKTCSEPTSLCDGQRFHSHIIESKLESDLTIVSALLDMYSNCRCIEHAFTVFNRIKAHNVFTWSTLIAGLVHNNYCKRALKVFASMQRAGCKPNNVTFVSVLSACCHAGLVDEGYSYFMLMYECQGMLPTLEHFNCLVELFSSCGYLWEAEHILLSIPFQHNIVGWTSLLRNCGKHKEILIARNSLDRALAIDCRHAALYITMSNIYNEIGMTEDAQEMLSAKKLLELQKL
ncbi:hypothetical protein KP509_11G083800 [Ceratopteris richardii]|nr:hypothetical protein KP509_11G083800 [Ceratopteris richardii]